MNICSTHTCTRTRTHLHAANGSVYITGYSIEDIGLSHNPETGRLLSASVLCSSRQLHDGSLTDKAISLSAGLNYLLASTTTGSHLTWGTIPGVKNREDIELYFKQSNIKGYACGACELAVLLR